MDNKKTNWKEEDKKFSNFEDGKIKIPNEKLANVESIVIKKPEDFDDIPNSKGVYWIWTNEPVKHILHAPNKNNGKLPKKIKISIDGNKVEGEIIYNGIAQSDIRGRIRNRHLLAEKDNGISGISIDIFDGKVFSHKKKVFSMDGKGKVPYIDSERIKTKEAALKLFLSQDEKKFIKETSEERIYFRNGINIFEPKHKEYTFIVFFIANLKSESYISFVEKKWRIKYGSPRLCSYLSGR